MPVQKRYAEDFVLGQPKRKTDKEINKAGQAWAAGKKDAEQIQTAKDQAKAASEIQMQGMMLQTKKQELADMIMQLKSMQDMLAQKVMPPMPMGMQPANGLPVGPPAMGLPPLPMSGNGPLPAAPPDMAMGGMSPQGMPPPGMSSPFG
jgi:hypothetical protein